MGILKELELECMAIAGTGGKAEWEKRKQAGFKNTFVRSFVSGFYAPRNIQRAQMGVGMPYGRGYGMPYGQRMGPDDIGPDFM